MLSAEELLAGSTLTYEIEIPGQVLHPALKGTPFPVGGETGSSTLKDHAAIGKPRPRGKESAQSSRTGSSEAEPLGAGSGTVRLRPLTVRDLQRISRAAKESDSLVATLMIQQALVEPQMSVAQVAALHVGLVQFLLQNVNQISGIAVTTEELAEAADVPLVRAAFVLAREFGWTPQQVQELTLGQVLLHLEMLTMDGRSLSGEKVPA
jgi:hypothetical protein